MLASFASSLLASQGIEKMRKGAAYPPYREGFVKRKC